MDINVGAIKELIEALGKSGMDKLNIETDAFKLNIERNCAVSIAAAPVQRTEIPVSPPVEESGKDPCGHLVTSPIVGTFYAGSAPDKPPFVKVGQQVRKGQTIFIVESMKLMNEVTSEYDGTVTEIYAQDGCSLEYGQPVMRIE